MTELSTKYPKAKTHHYCSWCNERIEMGEKYVYRTLIFQGDFQAQHLHYDCDIAVYDYFKRNDVDLDDGYELGSGVRGKPLRKDEIEDEDCQ